MGADVFLSYARSASAEHARAVRDTLVGRGVSVFLDERDIELADRFDERIVGALLDARVVVVFADEVYFTRWYCLWEWRVARTPFLTVAERRDATEPERLAALVGLVLALPPAGRPTALDRFPPTLRESNWPKAAEPAVVADTVVRQLATVRETLADRLDALPATGGAEALRAEMLNVSRLPAPLTLRGIDRAPLALPSSLNDHFVGRANDLWRIDDLLVTRIGGTPNAAALTGAISAMGGVGKTRLALEYLHRFGPRRFAGGLFWIDADESDTLIEQRHHDILAALVPDVPPIQLYRDPSSRRDLRRELVRAVEARAAERPVLVVLDNLPEPDPRARQAGRRPPPLDRWWPALGTTATLVTARYDVSVTEGHAVAPLTLAELDDESAVRMLVDGVVGRGALDGDAWTEIARWVGRLPLVLTVLNGALRGGGLDPAGLLAHARAGDSAVGVADEAFGTLEDDVHDESTRALYRHVSRALALSYDLLTPDARRAARLLAALAPVAVPLAVLNALPDWFPPPVRSALIKRSFVTPIPDPPEPPLFGTMHRVLADFLRRRVDDDGVTNIEVVVRAREGLLAVMTEDRGRDPSAWGLLTVCLPHVEEVLHATDAHLDALSEGAIRSVISLSLSAGVFLWSQGEFRRARTFEERAFARATRWLGAEHLDTLESANNLALTFHAQGDLTGARTLQERVLDVFTRLLGAEHPDALTSANNLAGTLRAQGDLAGARALDERVLAARTRLLGAEHPDTLTSTNNLAGTLGAQGDLAGARALHERMFEAHARLLGAEHPYTLRSANNLAATRRAQGDLTGARTLQERVVEVRTRLLGAEHPDTLRSANNLASTLYAQGELRGARVLQERVLAARTRLLGAEHPATLTSANNLALTLRAQGDLAGARALDERVFAARTRLLGAEHPDTLGSANNLAGTLSAQGDLAGARTLQEQVLAALTRQLGEEHPNTLTSMAHLAMSHWQAGDLLAAERLQRTVLLGRERALGAAHPDTLRTVENLAVTLRDRGDFAGARALRERRLELLRREHGPAAPETLTATLALAELMAGLGDRSAAAAIVTQARADAEAVGDTPEALRRALDDALAALGEDTA